MTKKKKIDVPKKSTVSTPGDDCDCPVCVFAKSQAPGDAYDLENCPRCGSFKKGENKKSK